LLANAPPPFSLVPLNHVQLSSLSIAPSISPGAFSFFLPTQVVFILLLLSGGFCLRWPYSAMRFFQLAFSYSTRSLSFSSYLAQFQHLKSGGFHSIYFSSLIVVQFFN